MTVKKLSRYDKIVRNISRVVNKIGRKINNKHILRFSGKMMDYIAIRNGVPKNSNCYMTKEYIKF